MKNGDVKNGKIFAGNIKLLMEMMGENIKEEEIFKMVSRADYRNDGFIDLD